MIGGLINVALTLSDIDENVCDRCQAGSVYLEELIRNAADFFLPG